MTASLSIFAVVYSINMSNLQQNNEIEHISKEINFLQDLLKKNEKSQNQFQNGLMQVRRIRVNKWKGTDFFQTKRIENIVRNIFQKRESKSKKC